MKENIIIDGYNLIRQSAELLQCEKVDIELARTRLIQILARYKRIKPNKIAVVFDGWQSANLAVRSHMERGIKVIFTKQGQKADDLVKDVCRKSTSELIIVTNDLEIKSCAERTGNVVISSNDFLQKMEMAQYFNEKGMESEEEEDSGGRITTKKKGNPRRSAKADRKRDRRLGKL